MKPAQLAAVWISLSKSALMAEKWKSADVAKPFKRLQRLSIDLLINVKVFY